MNVAMLLTWLNRAVIFGAIIMYGAMGETLTEKSGNMNLGTPGTMCVGGALGFVGAYSYELSAGSAVNPVLVILISLLCAFAGGLLCGLIFSFLTVSLKVNQNVVGLALTIFGSGLARFMGAYVIPEGATTVKAAECNAVFNAKLPIAESSTLTKIFLDYGFMLYLAIVVAIIMAWFLKKTRAGLNLRAVGENPATADAAGINVTRYKYLATLIGSGISGLGGVYYILDYNYGGWSTFAGESIEALGWLAVALVIFATWKPLNLLWGSLIFGVAYWLYNYISAFGDLTISSATSSLLEAIPYVVTIFVLILASVRKSREGQGPASLGLTYFREDR